MSDEAQPGASRSPRSSSLFSRRRFLVLAAGAGATLLSACGGSSGSTPAPTTASGGSGASGASTATSAATQASSGGTPSGASSAATPAASGAATPAATTAAAAGKPGGTKTFTFAVGRNLVTMDPVSMSSSVDYDLGEAIYNYAGRYTYNPPLGSQINPEVATWEVDAQAKTFTFKVKSGIKYHGDNGELTAADIAWNWNRMKDPNIPSLYRLNMAGSTTSTPDPQTLVVTFDYPNPNFIPGTVAFQPCLIMCPKAYQANSKDWNTKPIGSGPFEWVSFQPNSQVTLKRFDGYFGQKPKVDQIINRLSVDERTSVLAVSKGEIDAYYIGGTDTALEVMKNPPPNTKFIPSEKGIVPLWVSFNLKRTPFQDIRVRQAFRYAVDNDSIAKDLFGGLAQPIYSFLPPFMPGFSEDVPQLKYDPNKAKQLLKDANYPSDTFVPVIPTDSGIQAQVNAANMIQQFLGDIGVKIKIDLLDKGTFAQRTSGGDFDMVSISVGRIIPDQIATPFFHSGSSGNYAGYSGADDLIDQAKSEPDPTKQKQLYAQLQQKIAQDLPAVFMVAYASYLIYNTNRVLSGIGGAGWQTRFDYFNIDVPAT